MSPPYNRGTLLIANHNLAADTSGALTMMLVTTGYTYDADHNLVDDGTTDDPLSYEITVGGYARAALASTVLFEDDTNDHAGLDADNVTFSALVAGETIGAAVTFRYSTSQSTGDTGQELVAYHPVTATPTNGGDITISIADTTDGGLLKFKSTSS